MATDRAPLPLPHLEQVVLEMVIDLHPDHLTVIELISKVAADRNLPETEDLKFAIRDLRGSGLLRYRDDDQVVEPTYAALRCAALLLDGVS